MFAVTKNRLSAVVTLMYIGHVSGQCVRVDSVAWAPCGSPYEILQGCDYAYISFRVFWNEWVRVLRCKHHTATCGLVREIF